MTQEVFSSQRLKRLMLRAAKQNALPLIALALVNFVALLLLMSMYSIDRYYAGMYVPIGIILALLFSVFQFKTSHGSSRNFQFITQPYSQQEKYLVYGVGGIFALYLIFWIPYFLAIEIVPSLRDFIYMSANGYVPSWSYEVKQLALLKRHLAIFPVLGAMLMLPSLSFKRNILLINLGIVLMVIFIALGEPYLVNGVLNKYLASKYDNVLVTHETETLYKNIATPLFSVLASFVFVMAAYFKFKEREA